MLFECLTVLLPSHILGPLPKSLSLHIDAVFADEPHASLAARDDALAGSLPVILGVGGVKLVGNACLSHGGKLGANKMSA